MNFTIRQVQVFVVLCETRSFTRTAERLHMTQSAVSKQVADLENQLGFALFDRTTRRVEPNEAAWEFHGFARELMATVQAATRSVAEISNLDRGRISMAASPLMIYGLLADPIAQFRRRHPGVAFELHELSTDDTLAAVRSGEVDAGLCALDRPAAGLHASAFYADTMFAVVSAAHPLADRDRVTLRELAGWEHIQLRHFYSARRTLDALMQAQDLALSGGIEASTLTAVLGLVRTGAGMAVLPGYAARVAMQWGMRSLRIEDVPADIHRISLVRREHARLSLAARAFVAELQAAWGPVPDPPS